MRLRRTLFTSVLLSLTLTSTVSAHAVLLESIPAAEAVVAAPPRLVLRFNSRVEAQLSSVILVGGGKPLRVLLSSPDAPSLDTLIYSLPRLSPGRYRAEWRTLSVDGHVTDGVVRFTVIEDAR